MAEPDKKLEGEHVEVTADTPLIDSVSEDVSAEVGDFIQQAASNEDKIKNPTDAEKEKPDAKVELPNEHTA